MKYRVWKNGRRPEREYVVSQLSHCVCWGDLYRLFKWWLVRRLNRLGWDRRWCWVDLCHWAWRTWGEQLEVDGQILPYARTASCREDAQRQGCCYCGQQRRLEEAKPCPT